MQGFVLSKTEVMLETNLSSCLWRKCRNSSNAISYVLLIAANILTALQIFTAITWNIPAGLLLFCSQYMRGTSLGNSHRAGNHPLLE